VRGAASIALEMMPIEFLRQAIEAKLDAAPPQQKIGLMRVLASRNDKSTCPTFVALASHDDESVRLEAIKALAAVREAIDDPVTLEAALRALMEWPDAGATSDLLRLAHIAPEPKLRILALRGYVRGVGLASDRPAHEALALYQKGMQAATRVEDERLVLAGMGEIGHRLVIPALSWYAKRGDLKDEAGAALVKVALAIRKEHKDAAKAALKDVIGFCEVEHILKQAKEAYDTIEEFEDYVTRWLIAGPYDQKGKKNRELFDIPFAPEQADGDVTWRAVAATGGDEPWMVEIDRIVGGDHRACYLSAEVFSPEDRPARLEIGSDDGVKVWLNGAVVHANNVERGLRAREDTAEINLKSGWNALLMKITNGSGGWQACARIRASDGGHLDGMKYRIDEEILGGHIAEWQLAGPYTKKDKKGTDLFDIAFPPETPDSGGVEWKAIEAGGQTDAPWLVAIDKVLGGDERVCYLRVEVNSPKDQDAAIEVGSDDGVKVWLNGELVHANNAVRAVGIAQRGLEHGPREDNSGRWQLVGVPALPHSRGRPAQGAGDAAAGVGAPGRGLLRASACAACRLDAAGPQNLIVAPTTTWLSAVNVYT
jgi:hypothetical protein